MADFSTNRYPEEAIKDIIRRALKFEELSEDTPMPAHLDLTVSEVKEFGDKIGLSFISIEKAIKEYEYEQVRRDTYFSKTHVFEEREVKTTAGKNKIWQEVISELTFRMGGKPAIKSQKNRTSEWVFLNRSGTETSVSLEKTNKGIKLLLSRKIGIGSSLTESLLASLVLSLIVFGYSYVFFGSSFLNSTLLFLSMMILLPLPFKKMNTARRKKKQQDFSKLAEQVVEQIPRAKTKETDSAK